MKIKFLFLIVIFTSLFFSCENKDVCKDEMFFHLKKNSKLKKKVESMIFDSCSVTDFGKSTFYGRTETNEKGFFYKDSLELESVKTSVFYLTDTSLSNTRNNSIYVYDFSFSEEKNAFSKFEESMSRELWGTKEVHEFSEDEGKWILFLEGSI